MICPKCNHRKKKVGVCKFCERIRVHEFKSTFRGRLLVSWNNIKLRCRRKDRIKLEMTKEQFLEFSYACPNYLILFQEWKNASGPRRKWLLPSVDRIDDDGNYALDNIQWITWEQNYEKEMSKSRVAECCETPIDFGF